MPTTTKMGIVYPSSSDLVKDGATAMGTIATTVDAKSGLVLINTTSFTGVASQSINNVFTSSFTNYCLVTQFTPSTYGASGLRLRASGTDATGNNYTRQQFRAYGTTSAVATVTDTWWLIGASFNDDNIIENKIIITEIFSPNETKNTKYFCRHFQGADRIELNYIGGVHSVASAYDGFTIFHTAGNLTGTVSVYGYNK